MRPFPVTDVRARFPALQRQVGGASAVFFDGPAGSQVPRAVIDRIGAYLARDNANLGGAFATSAATERMLDATARAFTDWFGTPARDPDEIVFGANMTSLTRLVAAALARTWRAGDEIVVTRLDHDANVTPWVLAAERAGAVVRHVAVRASDCTLDLDSLRGALGARTRLVAVGAASNLVGTVNPVAEITALARAAGALVFVDAVHLAPHRALDVETWECDLCVCSAYKFFGPHVGVLWGRGDLLGSLAVDKLRPVRDAVPDRLMHGTQNHEGIAGAGAAVAWLEQLGRELGAGAAATRRRALVAAFAAIEAWESELCARLLRGLAEIDAVRVWGIADPARVAERVPTVSFTHARRRPIELAHALAERGVFTWHGNSYALPLTEALGLEPDGVLRVGLLHYNTSDEVDRLLACLRELG